MSDAVLTEISTALGDIVAHFDKSDETLPALLTEIGTALGDLVRASEGRKILDLTALVSAVKALELKAPAVTVQAPEVHNHMPPIQVVVNQPMERVTTITFHTNNRGQIETAKLVYSQDY
jgi:hypothetical protein